MSTTTSNFPSTLLSFKYQPINHRALRLLIGEFMSNMSVAVSCNTCTYHDNIYYSKCIVNSDNTQICLQRPSNNFQSTEKGKKQETSAEWIHRINLWYTNPKTQILKKDGILWTGTFNVCMMDKYTPRSFPSTMNTWILWISGLLLFLNWKGRRFQIFGNDVNKSKFYSDRN